MTPTEISALNWRKPEEKPEADMKVFCILDASSSTGTFWGNYHPNVPGWMPNQKTTEIVENGMWILWSEVLAWIPASELRANFEQSLPTPNALPQ